MTRLTATCHCGAVEIDAEFPQGLASAARCDCSFCLRRGAAAVTATTESLRIVKGADALTLYSWGTHTARHLLLQNLRNLRVSPAAIRPCRMRRQSGLYRGRQPASNGTYPLE